MFTKLQLSGPTHLSTVELIRDHQEADKHKLEVKSKMKYLGGLLVQSGVNE